MKKPSLLLFFLFLALCFSIFNHPGITLSDEYVYCKYAWQLTQGAFTPVADVFANRFGFWVPMAAFVSFLGASSWVFAIWSFISFILLIGIVYYFLSIYDLKTALISSLLIALNPALLQFSADVSPDLVMTTFTTLAIFILWKTQTNPNQQSFGYGLAVSFCLFYAFLNKLTVLFVAPFILFWLIQDWKKQQNSRFWISFFTSGLLLIAGYFLFCQYFTGDAFFRFNSIESTHGISRWTYFDKGSFDVIKRITILPVAFFLKSFGIGVFMVFSSLWLFKFDKKRLSELPNFLFLYTAILIFMHWFCTTSLTSYNPLLIVERLWLLIIPPLVILAVVVLTKAIPDFVINYKRQLGIFFLATLLTSSAGYYLVGEEHPGFLFTAIISLLFLCWIASEHYLLKKYKKLFLYACILVPLLGLQIHKIGYFKHNTSYFFQKDFLETLEKSKTHLLLTDQRLVEMHDAFFQFEPPENIFFKKWAGISEILPKDYDQYFVVFNKKREAHMEEIPGKMPTYVLDENFGEIILENNYLIIKELNKSEMQKISIPNH